MIEYRDINWQAGFLIKVKGSVFPRASMWALPCTFASIGLSFFFHHVYGDEAAEAFVGESPSTLVSLYASLTSILGFLIIFRTHSAYGRYWEGITLLRTARGEWFNAYSSLLAFSSPDPEKYRKTEAFQHQLARFMSIMNAVALQTVTDHNDVRFPTLDSRGIDSGALKFLAGKRDPNQRLEIVIQWIQRAIVEAANDGIVAVDPPILSRSFQEISRGAVTLTRARNMTEIPFPFPYVQLVTAVLAVHSCLTPGLMLVVLKSSVLSACLTFLSTFVLWGINYIAAEIESPFGNDANDLPLHRLQEDFNASLWALLDRRSQKPASFSFDKKRDRFFKIRRQSFSMVDDELIEAENAATVTGYGGSSVCLDSGLRGNSRSSLRASMVSTGAARSSSPKKQPFSVARPHVTPVLCGRTSSWSAAIVDELEVPGDFVTTPNGKLVADDDDSSDYGVSYGSAVGSQNIGEVEAKDSERLAAVGGQVGGTTRTSNAEASVRSEDYRL